MSTAVLRSAALAALVFLSLTCTHAAQANKPSVSPARDNASVRPLVHVMFYSIYQADYDRGSFGQWHGYVSHDNKVHNPNVRLGPEPWRYDLALGSGAPGSAMHYPYLGRYDNITNDDTVRWQFACMKNAGIDAVCASNLSHRSNPGYIARLLKIASEVGLRVYVMDENASEDLARAKDQAELDKTIDSYAALCYQTLAEFGAHPNYLKIGGRPVYFLPFWSPSFGEPGAEQVAVMQKALKRFHDAITRSGIHPWLFTTNVYCANFAGDLSYDKGIALPSSVDHMSKEWADTGFDSFTCWDPLGLGMQYNRRTISRGTLEANILKAFHEYVANQKAFGLTPIVPIQPGYDRRNCEGRGSVLPKSPPEYVTPHSPTWWRLQLKAAKASGASHIWIAQWNEWHEDQVIEPAWGFRDEAGREDPFAYLRILADELGRAFQEPPLPPEKSIDPAMRSKLRR